MPRNKTKWALFKVIWIISICLVNACTHADKQNHEVDRSGMEEISMITDSTGTVKLSSIALVDLQNNPVVLEELRGKIIVLNFWATWCKPCIAEMPSMDKAYQTLKNEDYVFLAASYEGLEKIQQFQKKHQFSFPFIKLSNGLEDLQIYSLPTTFVIDSDGKLVKTIVGSREWDSPEMITQLRELS